MTGIIGADSRCRYVCIVVRPGIARFTPFMADRGDRDVFGLFRESSIRERCSECSDAVRLAPRRGRDRVSRFDRLGLNVAGVSRANSCCRNGAVVICPGITRFAPVMADRGDCDFFGLGRKRSVRERSREGSDAVVFTIRRSLDSVSRFDCLGLDVACIIVADSRRRYACVVICPDVFRLAPVMADIINLRRRENVIVAGYHDIAPGRFISVIYHTRQSAAVFKCAVADARNGTGNDDALELCASAESVVADACDSSGDYHVF